MTELIWRQTVQATDIAAIRQLAESTKVFNDEEIEVAGELVEEKFIKGTACSYHFLFVENQDQIVAYSCIGVVPFTDFRFDLYWIAVDPLFQKQGLGRKVLYRSEELIKSLGGKRVYIETSSRKIYDPTRKFYDSNGYTKISELMDFYRDGDNKVIYSKELCKN